ncbi:heparanase-like protein 3 [Selaginella moellendorffii]|uniref:heparanase-like protein 3 n=1 Tax=Selaginella moellendorffii TaxID=88036 RepID=UPI000D1CA319|nr:heparanase-like protein 3 [Selaginella moellendorffii]|eukprot:XP_024537482.1 heparanase-like protein 3 [Selaginella moellendorffii]
MQHPALAALFILANVAYQGVHSLEMQRVVLQINTTSPVARISENFICATLDWWPPEKCDYGYCSWGRASLLNLDLWNPRLVNAVKGLSPLLLRLGGSLQDQIIYEVGVRPGPCLPLQKQPSAMFGFTGGCLNMSRWTELNSFFEKTGALVAFGLNALYGRTKFEDNGFKGSWKSSNARDLMKFSLDHGFPIVAWELGNELSGSGVGTSISAKQYAADIKELRSVVDQVYARSTIKPQVVAPDGFWDYGWFHDFLQSTGPNVVNACSHHIYNLGPGVDTHLIEKIVSPSYLSQEAGTFEGVEKLMKAYGTEAWVGEAGGAYNSGHHNVTDRYVFSFWYLDELGMSAYYNTAVYCRQSLIGGNYGLVDRTSYDLNPDYFSALLWKKLMGRNVFSATAENTPYLRTYAHCLKSNQGGLTVLIINLSNSTQYSVDLSLTHSEKDCSCNKPRTKKLAGAGVNAERMEYHLTAPNGDLQSPVMLLNGKPLVAGADGSIPELTPVTRTSSSPVLVDPYSIVFAVIPEAGVQSCTQ